MAWHSTDKDKIDRKRWALLRREVLNRDGWKCVKCGRRGRLEVDHILAMRFGGAVYDLNNLQTLDRLCHLEKSARENTEESEGIDVKEWREFVG